jgi:uncharacterized membrane protein YdjX (TVP38/TMEM64 family)
MNDVAEETRMPATVQVIERDETNVRAVRSRPVWKITLGVAVLAALLLVGRQAAQAFPSLVARVDALGPWGPVAFVAIYAVAVVALIPASILTLAAGALFGLTRGTAFTLLGATLGSAGAFLVSRYIARKAVERRVAGDARFEAIDRAIGERGFLIVFLLRLSPVFPFSLLNYALGLTRVRLRDFLLASVGMIPGTLLYVYSGRIAGDVAAAIGGAPAGGGTGRWLVMGLGLGATLVVTIAITRIARRAFAQKVGGEPAGGR